MLANSLSYEAVRGDGIDYERTIQAHVTRRVKPSPRIFELRRNRIAKAKKAFIRTAAERHPKTILLSDTIWTEGLSFESCVVRRGDPIWVDHAEMMPPDMEHPLSTGIYQDDTPFVFPSFSGRTARLPEGYVVGWSASDPESGDVFGVRAIYRKGPGDTLLDLSPEEQQSICRIAFGIANRFVKFGGIALLDYYIGDAGEDESGFAALVAGRVTLFNNSNSILLFGMQVAWELPTIGDQIFAHGISRSVTDARPRLVIYDPPQTAMEGLKKGFRRLLLDSTADDKFGFRMEGTDGRDFPVPAGDAAQTSAQQLLQFAEAVVLWTLKMQALSVANTRITATPDNGIQFRRSDPEDVVQLPPVSLLRLVMAKAMDAVPSHNSDAADIPAEVSTDHVAPVRAALMPFLTTITGNQSGPVPWTTGPASDDLLRPFAKVIVGADRNMPVDVLLL